MVRNANTFKCILYKKIKNKNEYEVDGKVFFARLTTQEENKYLERIQGFFTQSTRSVISVQDKHIIIEKGDKIEFLGDIRIVDNITNDYSITRNLGQHRMKNEYVKSNAPKLISLR